ncbi:hypothetical protein ABPG75_004884 [Micractinium tetrahymenae]
MEPGSDAPPSLPADQLWRLVCAFRQRAPASTVVDLARRTTDAGVLGDAAQQALLSACLLSPVAAMLPTDAEYKGRVLRAAVLAAEEDGQEVCEELMELYSACLLSPAATGASSGVGDGSGGDGPPGGTGCHEWEAGFFLAEWVLSHHELVAGRCCLEVGCGAGMVGVALHRAGASHVILTDGNPEAVANCRRNLALNGVPLLPEALHREGQQGAGSSGRSSSGSLRQQGREQQQREQQQQQQQQQRRQRWVECRQLCWEDGWPGGGSAEHVQQAQQAQRAQRAQQPTVVLGADLLYDPTVIPALLDLLKQVLAAAAAAAARAAAEQPASACDGAEQQQGQRQEQEQQPSAAYLATKLRNEATLQQFLVAAEADPGIRIQQLSPEPAAAADSSGSSSAVDAATAAVPLASSEQCAVCFQHLPELAAARSCIFLHRLTLAAPDC